MGIRNFLQFDKPPQIYLDHNATTPLDAQVKEAMELVGREFFGNPSSLHTYGREARGLIEKSRRIIADTISTSPEKVFFTSGGTEANNAVVKGVFQHFGKGHIITTKIEHESILGACGQIQERGGTVTFLPALENGQISLKELESAIGSDTILISVMHANNETGIIQKVKEIGKIARERKILFHTDAVQTFGKIAIDVDEIGCDFLTLTAHKIHGPKGCGALYCRDSSRFVPLIFGGDQELKRRAGTEGTHQIVGFGKAARIAAEKMQAVHVRLSRLRRRFINKLRWRFPEVRFNQSNPEHQLPGTINITFPGKDGLQILAGLDCYGIGVSIGSACTADRIEPSHVLLGMGISEKDAMSTIRVSLGRDNDFLDLVYFLWVLNQVFECAPPGFSYLDPSHLTRERVFSPKTMLIDVRLPHEKLLERGLPMAKNWSHIGFSRYFPEIPAEKEAILMCSTGIFSLGAGYALAHSGHPNVKVVFGGYIAWKALNGDLFQEILSG